MRLSHYVNHAKLSYIFSLKIIFCEFIKEDATVEEEHSFSYKQRTG